MSRIIPISQIKATRRSPELGRIRPGYSVERTSKKGKKYGAPVNSETWVLSAQTPEHLEVLAGDYGGRVEAWESSKTTDRFRLITETTRLHVVLPPASLSEPAYEKWEDRFIRRRCDGVTCQGFPRDGSPSIEVPCICAEVDDQTRHCKIKQHLGVLLPQTPIGVWRLTTTSRNAAVELQESVEVIRMASQIGLPRAVLTRQFRVTGEKEYWVPVLTTEATFQQLEAAASNRAAELPSVEVPRLALPPGVGPMDPATADDFATPVDPVGPAEIADGEVVDDAEPEGPNLSVVSEPDPEPVDELTAEERQVLKQMKATAPKLRAAESRSKRRKPSGDVYTGDDAPGAAGGPEITGDDQ